MRKVLVLSLPIVAVVVVAVAWPIITEAQSHTLAWQGVRWDRRPLQGTHGLASGFTPDPFPYRLTAGGGRNPVQLGRRAWAVAPTAAMADALSTAFMVMSTEEIRHCVTQYPRISAYVAPDDAAPLISLEGQTSHTPTRRH